jgi:hypothetical protein
LLKILSIFVNVADLSKQIGAAKLLLEETLSALVLSHLVGDVLFEFVA